MRRRLAGGVHYLTSWRWKRADRYRSRAQEHAVLPFENIGGDTANAYFVDGLTDELDALSKVPNLRVALRTASCAFRDARARDIAAIRDALKVGALLEGTVSRAGEQLRVSARLSNTTDGVDNPDRIDLAKLTRMTQWMCLSGWLVGNVKERPVIDPNVHRTVALTR